MMGKEKIVTKFLAVAAILNILLNLLLIPDYGAMGAVVASAITVLTWKLVIWYRLYLELKILPAGLGLLIKRGPEIS
jgi:O-antigen/teichoic acid export membrane protein